MVEEPFTSRICYAEYNLGRGGYINQPSEVFSAPCAKKMICTLYLPSRAISIGEKDVNGGWPRIVMSLFDRELEGWLRYVESREP
jgi:hypothetical protein